MIGVTEVPIDSLDGYTEETNGANLQADAAVWELVDKRGVAVDIHLSGAMSNRIVAEDATPATPVPLTNGDMFTLMPYENSLVVFEMTVPRSRRSWSGVTAITGVTTTRMTYGGYSHYTTCMLATNPAT